MSVIVSSSKSVTLQSAPQARRRLLGLLLLGLLAGCGKRGNLRLPDEETARRPEEPADEEIE
jgi:predicted small lipoprotein YifL